MLDAQVAKTIHELLEQVQQRRELDTPQANQIHDQGYQQALEDVLAALEGGDVG